jgi:hypothetical protein
VTGVGENYQCAVCHGIFVKTVSDEEALAEMRETWQREAHDDDPGIVCDDCYQVVLAWAQKSAPETLRGAR